MTMMAYGGWGSSSTAPPPLTLKLQVNTRTNRVVCAEAEKDMADLLFSFGNIPLGAAGRLLGRGSMGSFGNLSQSLGGLHASYIIDQDARDALLAPTGRGLLMLAGDGSSSSSSGGFVRGAVTYTVMDDLTVTPMSVISLATILKNNKIKDIGHLEERPVLVGPTEALELLKASLQSNTVLTDVFLRRA
ncbi:hypothetical protein CFC21_084974 [Triticum aestivum]|uniref:Uncharacterized protein n=2 Tax=Triticum aestivum TaxID=4565 RepID=A0A3B6I1X4_WHEAT|nr:hypothetical protein CFC21_084974 [Triticum aestivum]